MARNKSFPKSLQIYLSKLKKPTPSQLPLHSNSIKTSSNWILSGCRHPKTSSFSIDRNQPNNTSKDDDDDAATLTDVDRFLYENFNSLYCKTDNYNNEGGDDGNNNQRRENTNPGAFLFESPRLGEAAPPDVRPSNRFFVSPGTTNSLIEESRSSLSTCDDIGSSSTTATTTTTNLRESMALSSAKIQSIDLDLPDDSIAVLIYTRDPYEDFRQSMEEMVEDRLSQHETVDWDFMEELLVCYLKLNEKKSYKYILGAFVDLMVILRQNSSNSPGKPHRRKTDRH
ncbi:transcription repressor OFP14-like [Telopea speciosissima]|uniref:transcription repressor OFP14-like n=1 Tax=Telopea speciosissima TaxID=54955 RepID=UPI001CC50662|nr:transcription repressor OFP14-like [Telopea speciosissima]